MTFIRFLAAGRVSSVALVASVASAGPVVMDSPPVAYDDDGGVAEFHPFPECADGPVNSETGLRDCPTREV